ncbi:MAG: transposase, partial [Deinococcus sp.]|nr:transposase [Deinococcus sp.]
PTVSIVAFSIALAQFAQDLGAGADKLIVLLLDRAGWHLSRQVAIPEGIQLLPLPAYSPELQPAERLWSLTDEPIANRYFASIEQLEAVLAQRCMILQEQPEVIRAHTCFHWLPP